MAGGKGPDPQPGSLAVMSEGCSKHLVHVMRTMLLVSETCCMNWEGGWSVTGLCGLAEGQGGPDLMGLPGGAVQAGDGEC